MCGHILKPRKITFMGGFGSSCWIPVCGEDVSGCAQDLSQATLWVTAGAVKEGRAGSRAQLLPHDLGYDLEKAPCLSVLCAVGRGKPGFPRG